VVDATQGVEAQTVANAHLAMEHNLEMIPVINKIDLPAADPEKIKKQVEDILGIESTDAILASAKEELAPRKYWRPLSGGFPPRAETAPAPQGSHIRLLV